MKRQRTRQYTIRSVPAEVDQALRRQARARRLSLNAVVLEALRAAAGQGPEDRKHHDLDHLIGTMLPDPELDQALEDQRTIDPELWR